MALVVRVVIALWGLTFLMLGARGLVDPGVYMHSFGFSVAGAAANTIRADFSSFFLVSAAGALIAAVRPHWRNLLLVPAALFGTAMLIRLIGLAMGDIADGGVHQAILIEGATVALMLLGRKMLAPAVDPLVTPSLDNPS